MPSENAPSKETKAIAREIRTALGLSSKEYRKMLSHLRKKIKLVESQMSAQEWDKIAFDKIPSKAGLKYKQAFQKHPECATRYRNFMNSKTTTVNAGTLFPVDIVHKAGLYNSETDKAALDKYWKNLKDYFGGKSSNLICVCDTSGSMTWGQGNAIPFDVAMSLSIYTAERLRGPFQNCYISFSSRPQFVKIPEGDICSKVNAIRRNCIVEDTNLTAVFKLLKEASKKANPEDRPDTVVVISDMEINAAVCCEGQRYYDYFGRKIKTVDTGGLDWRDTEATMDIVAKEWAKAGLQLPKLVYWNVNARNNTVLQKPSSRVSYVSGFSPVIFEQILAGKTSVDLMLDKLVHSGRYDVVG